MAPIEMNHRHRDMEAQRNTNSKLERTEQTEDTERLLSKRRDACGGENPWIAPVLLSVCSVSSVFSGLTCSSVTLCLCG